MEYINTGRETTLVQGVLKGHPKRRSQFNNNYKRTVNRYPDIA